MYVTDEPRNLLRVKDTETCCVCPNYHPAVMDRRSPMRRIYVLLINTRRQDTTVSSRSVASMRSSHWLDLFDY
jgi:hypothetical protein